MSYFLEDKNGYLGDFATNVGVMDMHRDKDIPKSFRKFLDNGIADEALGKQVVEDLVGMSKYSYILPMLKKAKFPVVLTDGLS